MTTTIDPFGTPSVVQNRSGASIQTGVVLTGSLIATTSASVESIFLVDNQSFSPADGIVLPANAEVGDRVYVFNTNNASTLRVTVPTGESLAGYLNGDRFIAASLGNLFIKVGPTNWVFMI